MGWNEKFRFGEKKVDFRKQKTFKFVENLNKCATFRISTKMEKGIHFNLNSSTAKKCIPEKKTKLSREESYL